MHAEAAWRSRILARQGLHATLTGLAPSIRRHGMTLEAAFPRDLDLTLHGRGIILQPSLFRADRLLAAPQGDGRLLLIYPAVTPLPLRNTTPPDNPLTALVGSTRALALRRPRCRQRHISSRPDLAVAIRRPTASSAA
ncbi:hypothetical protein OHA45_02285 [Streptomyces lydicus]|uniref:hypothetical protein n=1 Tax=Streptomyces lydicus TaxID=47763 RepID=UPI002E36A9A0|nr:hypothetical protein [Streptomyces lydicus]